MHHTTLRPWLVTITLRDGSRGQHLGVYPHGCAAIVRAMDLFPKAARISARCVRPATTTATAVAGSPGMTAPRRYTCEQLGVCQATPDCTCPRAPTLATAPVAAPLTPAQAVSPATGERRPTAASSPGCAPRPAAADLLDHPPT